MSHAPFVAAGRVVKSHGLKGEVSVIPAEGLPFVFQEGVRVWLVPPPAGVREGVVEWVRNGPKGPLVKISGIEDIGSAGSARGCTLMVDAGDVPDFDMTAPFDPVGLEVRTDTGLELGSITELIRTGANDVWVVRGDSYGEVLLPVIDDVVLEIDEERRSALVHVLPGLMDCDGENS